MTTILTIAAAYLPLSLPIALVAGRWLGRSS